MAFKQSNNPISRKTSPLRAGGFTLSELKETSQAASELSEINSESGNVGAPGDPGTNPNYNSTVDDDNEFDTSTGRPLTGPNIEPPKKEAKAPSRKASPLNDDGHPHAHTKKAMMKKTIQEKPQVKVG